MQKSHFWSFLYEEKGDEIANRALPEFPAARLGASLVACSISLLLSYLNRDFSAQAVQKLAGERWSLQLELRRFFLAKIYITCCWKYRQKRSLPLMVNRHLNVQLDQPGRKKSAKNLKTYSNLFLIKSELQFFGIGFHRLHLPKLCGSPFRF